jgi:hypothetical protein
MLAVLASHIRVVPRMDGADSATAVALSCASSARR